MSTVKISRSAMIKWIITIVLPALLLLVPTNEVFTSQVRTFLIITFAGILVLAFEFFDSLVPAVLIPIFYLAFNLAPASVIYSGWTTTTPMMVFGALLLAAILQKTGLLERIAYFCIIKTGCSYRGVGRGLYIAGVFSALITSCNSWAVYAVITLGVIQSLHLGVSKQSAGLIAIASTSVLGQYGWLYAPANVGLFSSGLLAADPSIVITWTSAWWNNLPSIFLGFVFTAFVLYVFVPKTELEAKEVFQEKYDSLGKIDRNEKITIVIFVGMLIYLVTYTWHSLAPEWAFMFVPWLFFLPGIEIANTETLKGMNYSLLFLIVAFLGIGNTASHLGVSQMVSDLVSPYLQSVVDMTGGNMLITLMIFLIGFGLNFILTPFAIYGAFTAPLAQLAADLGFNPLFIQYVLVAAGDSILLPYESVGYLLFYSLAFCKIKDWIKLFGLKSVMWCILVVLISTPFWRLIGVM